MVTNYRRGYLIERKAKKILEDAGYFVVRTAGSHSLFDIIAIDKVQIRLIQLKRVKGKYYSFKKEIEEIKLFKNMPINASKELWIYLDKLKDRPAHFKEEWIR